MALDCFFILLFPVLRLFPGIESSDPPVHGGLASLTVAQVACCGATVNVASAVSFLAKASPAPHRMHVNPIKVLDLPAHLHEMWESDEQVKHPTTEQSAKSRMRGIQRDKELSFLK